MVHNLIDAFAELKAAHTSIILVEQNFEFVRDLGDQVAVMDDGRIRYRGAMRELPMTKNCKRVCLVYRWRATNENMDSFSRSDEYLVHS